MERSARGVTGTGIDEGGPARHRLAGWRIQAVTRHERSRQAFGSATTCTKYGLFRTGDGGLSWSSLGNPTDSAADFSIGHLVGPLFASPTLGWLALNLGAGGVLGTGGLLTTEDGGRTWRCASRPPNTYLVSAADPLHLWVTSVQRGSGATTLYSSHDAGATWHPLDLSAPG